MRILFVHGNVYAVGGIETWLTRVMPRVRAEGHDVGLLTRPPGEPWDVTTAIIERISQDATVHLAGRHWFGLPRSLRSRPAPADVLFACNLPSLLMAVLVQQHLMPEARIVAGVFHPREYSWRTPLWRRRWVQHLAQRVLRELPAANFLFFSPSMESHPVEELLGRDLGEAPVVPIPIDTDRLRPPSERSVDRGKIVSVTRLAPYYTHNRHMIRVIRDLRDRGHAFTYHSYGDGEERPALEAEARALDVDNAVFLHGTVPYERFGQTVQDAFAYIGIGTGLLEAAACGVPALVAIDSHPHAASYGFIHETVGNALGGYIEGHPEHPIADRLLWLASRTGQEYRRVQRASRVRAEEFSLARLLPQFVEFLGEAAPYQPRISRADRAIGLLDWVLEAVLLNLGARDVMVERYMRPALPAAYSITT